LAGLDVGDKRIGVAVSDALAISAQPLATIERRSLDADRMAIMELLDGYEVDGFVAGLPLRMDGSEGIQADRVRHFCRSLQEGTGLTVEFQDERLSSAEGERLLLSAGTRRARRRRTVDMTAAVLILQTYLDREARA
jgi:putative Holliday junction resolvase